jgi:hypothetical protein
MSASNTDGKAAVSPAARQRELLRRFRARPMGPYDAELQAMLLPLRNVAAAGKHALMRLPSRGGWTLVRLGGRGRPVEILGGCWTSRGDAEWAVLRARWQALHGEDPEPDDD